MLIRETMVQSLLDTLQIKNAYYVLNNGEKTEVGADTLYLESSPINPAYSRLVSLNSGTNHYSLSLGSPKQLVSEYCAENCDFSKKALDTTLNTLYDSFREGTSLYKLNAGKGRERLGYFTPHSCFLPLEGASRNEYVPFINLTHLYDIQRVKIARLEHTRYLFTNGREFTISARYRGQFDKAVEASVTDLILHQNIWQSKLRAIPQVSETKTITPFQQKALNNADKYQEMYRSLTVKQIIEVYVRMCAEKIQEQELSENRSINEWL
ncbi:MAG: hypothetical protein LKJ03_03235 [Enterococcaceae bacterium]|nr:hypothetical protein [Enterococcaceae bacterium]MCI1919038.1 hypothetical protein [Enterococcaceae bacterium]